MSEDGSNRRAVHRASDGWAYAEDGALVPSADFAYDELSIFPDSKSKDSPPADDLSQKEMDAALQLFNSVARWMWQDAMKNSDGLKIRAAIICWVFLKPLRGINLTQLATGFGLDKQSMGRWVDDFKATYPRIRTHHMR